MTTTNSIIGLACAFAIMTAIVAVIFFVLIFLVGFTTQSV